MLALLPGYRQFRCRVSPLAVVVGALGVVIWVGLCKLRIEQTVLGPLGLDSVLGLGERAASTRSSNWPTGRPWPMRFWPCGSRAWRRSCR